MSIGEGACNDGKFSAIKPAIQKAKAYEADLFVCVARRRSKK